MNYLIQRGKVRGQVINVPEGLPELLSDITREVLRCQPTTECLCQFIIDYLHAMIVTREKARAAKYIIDNALHQVDQIISDLCICDITKSNAMEMALLMEACFKRFLERYRCENHRGKEIVKFGEEDMLDELINRCKFSEEELKISRPLIEQAYQSFVETYMVAAKENEGTEALYLYFKERERKRLEIEREVKAAILIQASFRGYSVRKLMFLDKKARQDKEMEGIQLDAMDHAARIIQHFFRAHSKHFFGLDEAEDFEEHEGEYGVPEEVCSPKSALSLNQHPDGEKLMPSPKTSLDMLKVEAPPIAEPEPQPGAAVETVPETSPEPVPEVVPEPQAEPAPEPAPEAAIPAEPEATQAAEDPPAEPAE